MHSREIRQISDSLQNDAKTERDIGTPINLSEIATRVIGICDRHYETRLAWLSVWLKDFGDMPYRSGDTRIFSQASRGFRALLFHGNDEKRMVRILREARGEFPAKPVIALIQEHQPKLVAELLNAGADDVLDLNMSAIEAAARFRAVARRRLWLQAEGKLVKLIAVNLASSTHFSKRELIILDILEKNINKITPYYWILRQIGRETELKDIKALQVAISLLKRKLPEEMKINNERGEGYRLELKAA
jgi:DNA-binding response OmpR family regulator